MIADSIETTDGGRLFGEITSRGRLLDPEGNPLAEFTQRTQMMLGSRVIPVEIELNPLVPPRADPWRSYYACRFAWAERATDLARDVHLASQSTSAKRIEAPHFLELQSGAQADSAPDRRVALSLPIRGPDARQPAGGAGRDGAKVPAGHRHRCAASRVGGARFFGGRSGNGRVNAGARCRRGIAGYSMSMPGM